MDTANKDSLIALRAELVMQQQELSRECRAPTRSMLLHLEHRIAALTEDLEALEESRVPPSKSPLPPPQLPAACMTPSSSTSTRMQEPERQNDVSSLRSTFPPQSPLSFQGTSREAAMSQRSAATADSDGIAKPLHSFDHVDLRRVEEPATTMSNMPAAVLGDVFLFLVRAHEGGGGAWRGRSYLAWHCSLLCSFNSMFECLDRFKCTLLSFFVSLSLSLFLFALGSYPSKW